MMKTILVSYRVSDPVRSVAFYVALGYLEVGQIGLDNDARLIMLRLPEEAFASLELVYRPGEKSLDIGNGFDHLAIQVDALAPTLERLAATGLQPGPIEHPGGADGPEIAWISDPDGYRIELVEWPAGHAGGISERDFA